MDEAECSKKLSEPLGSSKFFPKSLNFSYNPATSQPREAGARGGARPDAQKHEPSVAEAWGKYGFWLLNADPSSNPEIALYNHVQLPG